MKVVDLVSQNSGSSFATCERMATAIVDFIRRNGDCLPQDLSAQDFTPKEVAEHWRMARALAQVELTELQDEPDEGPHAEAK